MTWHDGRPVFSRLPEKGYKDNDVADSLTAWVDAKLTAKADQLQGFYRQLDPDTADERYLDYLAWLVGLSGSHWDTEWPTQTKRKLIKASHSYLWPKRGTAEVISFVLTAHNIKHDLWTDGSSAMPFKMPKAFGANRLRFFIRLPVEYQRSGKEFREALRTARNFAPAIVQHKVCYQGFKIGFSRLGEPMF